MDNNSYNSCCGHGHVWLKIVAILMLGAIVIVAMLRDRIVNNQFRQITAMGQGRVAYTPDKATVNLGVQIDKVAKPEDALNKLNDKMGKVIAAVKAAGIAEEDIVTDNYTLVPQYDYAPIPFSYSAPARDAVVSSEIAPVKGVAAAAAAVSSEKVWSAVGYSANQQLNIKIKDLKNNQNLLNKVVGEATTAGANQILGISFEASNLDDLKQQARVKAIEDAKTKAVALAAAAGVKLKDINGWYENFVKGGYYGEAAGIGGGGGLPQVTIGDNEVLVEIGVTYNIK